MHTSRALRALPVALALWLAISPAGVRAENEVKPQRNLFEIGLYLGALLPTDQHELYQLSVGHQPLADAAFHIGGRLAYLPWSYGGIEIEGGAMPTKVQNDASATLFTFRGHVLVQYPAIVSPFVVVGGGLLGVSSGTDAVGDDIDFAFHLGIGVKFYVASWLVLRVDARQNISGKLGPGGRDSLFEFLGGASFILGWKKPKPKDTDGDGVIDKHDQCPNVPAKTANGCPPPDTDKDGVPDDKDKCPKVPANTPDGCPPPDTDGDGVIDAKDKCPKIAAKTPDGCPGDSDGDGVRDDKDKCPKVPAKTPDGCPPPDRDKDGIPDAQDKCPDQPETKNGFQDEDGCPDTVPKKVKRFTGTIKGIYFASGKAKIRRASFRLLNRAVKVLNEFKSVRLKIRGHTDSRGKLDMNMKLSLARAQAVVDYFTGKGVDKARLLVEGVGPQEPVADNKTAKGRAKNRRIEFKIILK
ncbi:MAG: OmpA family protein [Myxococcales bacterium]|nr:OmpA family protein [Myxococcales bacterium]